MASSSAAPAGYSKDGSDIEKMHKIWGKLEVDSSCSSCEYNRKVAMMKDKLQNISITSSSNSVANSICRKGEAQEAQDDADSEEGEEGEEMEEDPALATKGSQLHSVGQCRPCHFFRAGNICRHGPNCDFCHYHSDLRRKRPGKRRRAKLAARKQREAEVAAQGSGAGGSQAAPAKSIVSL